MSLMQEMSATTHVLHTKRRIAETARFSGLNCEVAHRRRVHLPSAHAAIGELNLRSDSLLTSAPDRATFFV